jgi:hypothetical protein
MDQIMTAFADKSMDIRALERKASELLFERQQCPNDPDLTVQQMDRMHAAFKSKDTLHDALSVVYSFTYMGRMSRPLCQDLVGSLIEKFPPRHSSSARPVVVVKGESEDVVVITEDDDQPRPVPNSMQSVREARKVKLAEAKSKQAKLKYQTLKSNFDKTQPDIKSAKTKRVQIEADLARAVEAENALNAEYTRLVAEVSQAYAESQAAETAHEEAILAAARAARLAGEGGKRAKH